MIYDRRFGLPQSIADYLNQPLPDISGIFGALPPTAVVPDIPEDAPTIGLTPEQLALLYPQYNLGGDGDGGGDNEEDYINRIDNNAGIYSMKDLVNYTKSIPTAARIGSLFGPFGFAAGLIGTSIADRFGLTQAGRDRIARETAAMRGSVKDLQSRIDRGDFDGPSTSASKAAANREARRGGQYDRDTGGGGGGGFGGASPGSQGPGGSDEMGSF